MLSFILNLPYTIVGIILAIFSLPIEKVYWIHKPSSIVFHSKNKSFWWARGYMRGARATTMGHVIILSSNLKKNDLEHELVHIEQSTRLPIVFPFLYCIELFRKGYRNNKYEMEAYSRAGNVYKYKRE
jgi:hypothetical protein